MRKWLIIGISLLFVGITYSPVSDANKVDELFTIKQIPSEKSIQIHCYEYKSDGTIEKTIISLPKSEYHEMKQALWQITSLEEKLDVYQRYGIIPSNITIQQMKEKYDQYLITKNIDIDAPRNQVPTRKNIFGLVLNFNCKINVMGRMGIHLNLGMSAVTQFLNFIAIFLHNGSGSPSFVQGIDLCDFCCYVLGDIDVSEGVFQDYTSTLAPMTMMMLGFVGYFIVDFPLPMFHYGAEYLGYTVFIFATGLRYGPEYLTT